MKDRIVELRRVRSGDLQADPRNWRLHPPDQEAALRGMLGRIGWADAVIARETADGLYLVDGHLRAELDPDQVVPVLIVDLDATEAAEVMATLDAIAGMAVTDTAALTDLLAELGDELPDELTEALEGLLPAERDTPITDVDVCAAPRYWISLSIEPDRRAVLEEAAESLAASHRDLRLDAQE